MSLSLSKSWKRVEPPRLDIKVGCAKLTAEFCGPCNQQVLWKKEWPLGGLDLADSTDASQKLESVISEVDQLVGKESPEIQMIIPDPFVAHHLLSVDDFPKKIKEQKALIRWMLKDQCYFDSDGHEMDYSVSYDNGKMLISVFSIRSRWLDIARQFGKHNLLVASLYPEMLYQISIRKNNAVGFFIYQSDHFIGGVLVGDSGNIELYDSQLFDPGDEVGRQAFLKRIKRDYLAWQDIADNHERGIGLYLIGGNHALTTKALNGVEFVLV